MHNKPTIQKTLGFSTKNERTVVSCIFHKFAQTCKKCESVEKNRLKPAKSSVENQANLQKTLIFSTNLLISVHLEQLSEPILDPILGSFLEASASPKRGSKMAVKPRAKPCASSGFFYIFTRIPESAEAATEPESEVHLSPRPPPLLITFLTEQV